MWHLPWLICVVVLAALLLVRESQNARIQKGLIDKILVSKGSEPLPASPVEQLLEEFKEHREVHPKVTEEMQKKIEKAKRSVHFKIPGMPEFRG